MDKKPLFIVGMLIIGIGAISSYSFYKEKAQESEKIVNLKNQIEVLRAERANIAKKIEDINVEKEALQKEAEEYDWSKEGLKAQIKETIPEKETLLAELSDKEKALSKLESTLESIDSEEAELNEQLEKAKDDYQQTLHKIESTRREKAALEENIKTRILAPPAVELKKIVVRLTPPLEGKVIEINKRYGFAIIGLGSKDNIKNGDIFGLYRKGQLIAKAACENVYDDMSSIKILDEWSGAQLIIGDTATLQKP